MDRYICIHGHFYQPPRENPWLEDVEFQDSAYPYHDWNERITDECYEPNTSSRILSEDGWIKRIADNYSKMSFNFGPTLLSWMEINRPEVYRAIIESDIKSRDNFSGHGSALAQAYNHIIMPLANRRDKTTQVIWGIKDFEHRFGRKPEGMWLPETAVDLETLDIMAQYGIAFTILAPYQARRVRKIGTDRWNDIGHEGIDTTMPYVVRTGDNGRSICVFFYNGAISSAVAFERLLSNGERFAMRLLGAFQEELAGSQLVNIATDGETYGHHHRHGDMALAYATHFIETKKLARIINYPEYLKKFPPGYEVEIKEESSWSCAHGVERWRGNCGCNSGLHPGWGQAWRSPLRKGLNWLRDEAALIYEEMALEYFKNPWEVRNNYIDVVLNRTPEKIREFIGKYSDRNISDDELVSILEMLEMQRYAMLMFTSCGWFFDDISGIETIQILQYAGRVIQLARELSGKSLEDHFLAIISEAKSNDPGYVDGARIYEKYVKTAMVDLLKVGAHYAICSLFESCERYSNIYCYEIKSEDSHERLAGGAKLSVGRIRVTSQITRESENQIYGVVNFGMHNLIGGIRYYQDEEMYRKLLRELIAAFQRADFSEVLKVMSRYFEGSTYTLRELFRDKQRDVLDEILNNTLSEITSDYRRIYKRHAPLMRFLKDLGMPQPRALQTTAEFVLNISLREALSADELDIDYIDAILDEVSTSDVSLDAAGLGYVMEQTLERIGEKLTDKPYDSVAVTELDEAIALVESLPFRADLRKVQNIYYKFLQTIYTSQKVRAAGGDREAGLWVEQFNALGDKLRIRRGK
ncbi:MAG: DUF3536 domain-containing protein [Bacillota bacterium]